MEKRIYTITVVVEIDSRTSSGTIETLLRSRGEVAIFDKARGFGDITDLRSSVQSEKSED